MSAAITAAVIGIVGAAGSAVASKQAADKQNKRLNTQNATQAGYDLASRGAPLYGPSVPSELQGRESAILPYYVGDEESRLGRYAAQISRAIRNRGGTPEQQLAKYEEMMAQYENAAAMADQAKLDEITGAATEQELEFSKPVFAARTGVAEAKRNAGLEALREILNEIDSIQAGKGYSGDSTGTRMLRFDARRRIGTDAAEGFANANLQNEEERRVIRTAGRDRSAEGGTALAKLFNQRVTRSQLPALAVASDFNTQFAPLKNFNIGTGEFTTPASNVDQPDILGSLTGSIGGTLTNFFAKKAAENAEAKKLKGPIV